MHTRGTVLWAVLVAAGLTCTACRQDMHDQPRYEPLEASTFFEDGRASRAPVPGTVARGLLDDGGLGGGPETERIPFPVTRQVLDRGQERYDIYCSPCHDRVGTGEGMIVQRGFKRPPSLHQERLRIAPVGYFFQVITNGFGVMSGYAAQISARDRWAIVGYIRALQLSQHATLQQVPADERTKLEQERDQTN